MKSVQVAQSERKMVLKLTIIAEVAQKKERGDVQVP